VVRTDRQAAERAIADFLRALGHEPTGELAGTPALVAQAWTDELLAGYRLDPAGILGEGFVPIEPSQASLVALRGLDVSTICPHHLLPAHGEATVIYLPANRVAGFGAIARALDALTRRLTFQERVGADMARLIVAELGARGALCALRLVHTCLTSRGARQAHGLVDSVAFAGSFAEPGPDRDAALRMLGSQQDTSRPTADPHSRAMSGP
jgi:GTP cyclohydrolase I